MAGTMDLPRLLVTIANLDHKAAVDLLDATPSLATAGMARLDEFFPAERLAQVYEGDTALHAAGFSYDPEMAQDLITRGADIRARNRRGAEPLHAAVIGVPGSNGWNPTRQRDVILYLIEAGADPNAAARRRRHATPVTGPLLETKFHARMRRRGVVARSRLKEHLGRAGESALTLVSAPAGFGKTT